MSTKAKRTIVTAVGVLLAVGLAMFATNEINRHRNYPGLAGVWEGTCYGERAALKITRTNGVYVAGFDYVDAGIILPAIDLEPGRNTLSFWIAGTREKFTASIDPGMTQMAANWRQGTNNNPFTLKRMASPDIPEPLTEADYAPRTGSEFQAFWRGIIQAGPKRVAVNLKIAEPVTGTLRAEMDRVDWGGLHIPATSITRAGNTIKIGFVLLGSFAGRLDPVTKQLSGDWTQDKRVDPATFSRVDLSVDQTALNYTPASPSELPGHWKGTLKLPGGQLHFVFHIARLRDGSLSATMDDPDQGQNDMQATTIDYTPPKVSIMWRGIGSVFNGALTGGKLSGMCRWNGKVHPLTLTRDQ